MCRYYQRPRDACVWGMVFGQRGGFFENFIQSSWTSANKITLHSDWPSPNSYWRQKEMSWRNRTRSFNSRKPVQRTVEVKRRTEHRGLGWMSSGCEGRPPCPHDQHHALPPLLPVGITAFTSRGGLKWDVLVVFGETAQVKVYRCRCFKVPTKNVRQLSLMVNTVFQFGWAKVSRYVVRHSSGCFYEGIWGEIYI